MAFVGHLCMTFASGIELLGCFWAFQVEFAGWEPLWVMGVECFNYFLATVKPGTGDFILANGSHIPWLRYFGWLVTCPVLLMARARTPPEQASQLVASCGPLTSGIPARATLRRSSSCR